MTMVMGPVLLAGGLPESVTVTGTVVLPDDVGVPVIVHVLEFSARPGGNAAVIVHVYGPVPPVMPIGPVYGTLIVPAGGDVITIGDDAGLMVKLTGPVVLSWVGLESVAITVRFTVLATVGVPWTVQPVKVSPACRVPLVIVQEYGAVPPETPMVWL
jgi:hypothetical protein